MRRLPWIVLLTLAACRIERIQPPPGRATAVAAPTDTEVVAALERYYDRFSRRAWREFRQSFWPTATIATRWQAPGDTAPRVHVQTLDQFLAATRDGPDRLAVFEERMVHHEVRRYGDLATAWVTFRATFGMPDSAPATHYGVDAFVLLQEGRDWRILSLGFTPERAGDSLPKGAAALAPPRSVP